MFIFQIITNYKDMGVHIIIILKWCQQF